MPKGSSSRLTREDLIARRFRTGEVELSEGGTVAVRGLTRAEVQEAQRLADADDGLPRDRYLIAYGLTDPVMSPEDVDVWAANAPAGDTVRVEDKIAELSGLKDTQPKEDYKSV